MNVLASARDEIRFLLDGEIRRIRAVDPATTVLNYLRESLNRCGSKEGCAEGDCGACTVQLAELDGDTVVWRTVNSCIQFLPTLDGKAIFTVESLRKYCGGRLHPVQQAMVECHGSQCGFCTPGFVMSLLQLFKTESAPGRDAIDMALSGNLCRCTGYRPIIDAAGRMYRIAAESKARSFLECPAGIEPARNDVQYRQLMDRLRDIQPREPLVIGGGRYAAPLDLDDFAERVAAKPQALILSGGTDAALRVTKQLQALPDIIWLGQVRELQHIVIDNRGIEIGAAVSLTRAFAALTAQHPELGEIARRFASPPIRNAGTLCGNIANGSPIGDSMPALIALGAEMLLRRSAETRWLPLDRFYLGYRKTALQAGEFVQAVRVPPPAGHALFRSYKISKRFDQDISAVCAAFGLRIESGVVQQARVCFGGMAEIPKRAPACEGRLSGRPWNEATVRAAMQALSDDYSPLSDLRAGAAYRLKVAANLLYRCFIESTVVGTRTRVTGELR